MQGRGRTIWLGGKPEDARRVRALVTGGTGFVGGPFVDRILQDGWHVTLVTRNGKNARKLTGGNLTVCEADVSDEGAMHRIAKTKQVFDVVFHLAASLDYFGEREALYRTNVQGTRNVLELARETSVRKFVYASSIEATGPVRKREVPAPPEKRCRPVSAYGESKALAEKLVLSAVPGHFPVTVLRIGNVYGPGHFNFILEIAEAILQRNRLLEFLPVYADRYIHPVHNDDVTEGILAAYRSAELSSVAALAGEYATVGELFQICSELLGKRVTKRRKKRVDEIYLRLRCGYHRHKRHADFITYLMAGSGKRVHRAYSIEETKKMLSFSPRVSLRTGIEDTLNWAMQEGLLPCGTMTGRSARVSPTLIP